jgi:hypothetical protein
MSRPGRPGPGFPILSSTLGGDPGQPEGNPPPPDCCVVSDADLPDRAADTNGQRWEGGGGGSDSYTATVIADGPVHYWRMNQGGATEPDIIASLDGTPAGAGTISSVAGATGDGDTALAFSNKALSLVGVGDLPVGSAARSVEFLYKGTNTLKQTVFSYGTSSATRQSFAVAVNQGGDGTIGIWTWSDDHSTAVVVNDGDWHHIVVTYAAASSSVLLYVDGVLEDTYSLGGTLNTGTTDAGIAHDFHTGAHPVTGSVDEVAVYDSVLSGADVTAHFDAIATTGGSADWVPASNALDDDDATYDTIVVDSNGMYRLDLGAAYRIQTTRIRIAGTTAGARTFTIKGANLADFSDEVTLDTIDFTATGGLTAQNVTGDWYTEDSYRYWQLDIDDSDTYRLHSWELYEPTLATNHQHPVSISLDDLTDVNAPSPSNNDVLTWDSTPGEWVAAAPTGGGSTVDIEDEGAAEGAADTIDFTGSGVSVTFAGGTATVDIPGGGGSIPTEREWLTEEYETRDYPASPNATYDDEFNDETGMSGSGNGLDARWNWRNQGSATSTFPKAGWMTLTCPSAAVNWRILEIAAFADGTYEAHIAGEGAYATGASTGFHAAVVLVDGTNGDFYNFGMATDNTTMFYGLVQRWTNVTTFNSNVQANGVARPAPTSIYLRVTKSGTTLGFWYSEDGVGWVRSATITDAVSATRIGVAATDVGSTGIAKVHVDYFRKVA